MPALVPSSAMAVSQLPRWPMVSLSWSSAEAATGASKVAAARKQPKRPARFMFLSSIAKDSPRLDGFEIAQPAHHGVRPDRQHEHDDQQRIHARHVEGRVAVDDEEADAAVR